MLYLINCTIIESYYLNGDKKLEKNHIVDSDSEQNAKNKIKKYYDDKYDEFYVRYYVDINYCNEII